MKNDLVCPELGRIPSYRSNIFSTQIFQELLETVIRHSLQMEVARRGYAPPGDRQEAEEGARGVGA